MWNYNLYGLRPSAGNGFMSQIFGSNNIKGTCEDFKQDPIWSYVNASGYKVGIFESHAGSDSLSKSISCDGSKDFLKDAILWKMEKSDSSSEFHYLGSEKFTKGTVYYDKSCKKGACFATLFDNVKSVWKRFKKEPGQTIFIIRDFSYLKAIKNKNIAKAREILLDLEKSLAHLEAEFNRGKETLFLVTSSEAQNFEMPKKGKEWFEFETKGKKVIFRNTSLLSPVLSKGAGSENFCGVFEEYEVLKRIFWTTDKKAWNPLDVF